MTTAAGGSGTDDPFTMLITSGDSSTLANTLDSQLAASDPNLAAQLDATVDSASTGTTDADPFVDLLQAFDPSAFSSTGAPADFLAEIAVELDTALAPSGISAALDPIADTIISDFGVTGTF